jgi:hypothetical protein
LYSNIACSLSRRVIALGYSANLCMRVRNSPPYAGVKTDLQGGMFLLPKVNCSLQQSFP